MNNCIDYKGQLIQFVEKGTSGKSLSLTVQPNQKVILRAPTETSEEKKLDFVRRKAGWIVKQLRYFQNHEKPIQNKEYISGEGFWYLGRQYKIIVKGSTEEYVEYDKNKLFIHTTKAPSESIHNKRILNAWLRKQRRVVFTERFEECKKRFEYTMFPNFVIKKMEKRWGSFIDQYQIVLNPKLIHVATDCIDYVIVHELCHMKYKNHSKFFFDFLSKKYPGWQKVKEKLEMSNTI